MGTPAVASTEVIRSKLALVDPLTFAAWDKLETSLQLRDRMLDVSVDCIKVIAVDGTLIHMNRSGCLALGVPVDETEFGMKWLDRLPQEVRKRGKRALAQARDGKNARFAGKSALPGQKPQYWDNLLTPMKDAAGNTVAILCVSRNVSLQRDAEARLRYASEVDALTGLWNRRSFQTRLQRSIARSRDKGTVVGLLLADLDYFKHVNDTLGHAAGDHLLRMLSRRLQECVPKGACVSRLGGDEFAIVIPGAKNETEIMQVAHELLQQTEAPITFAGKIINGGMSIGCALYPRDANDVSGLLQCADTALNNLKSEGRGGVQMFNADMMALVAIKASQLGLARAIVHNDSIVPCYQPRVSLSDRRIVGLDAQLRWMDTTRAVNVPDTIAAAFTDYELATRISESMHRKVFADMADWRDAGRRVLPVSLNAAPVEFLRNDYAERLLSLLEAFQLPPNLIEIGITEYLLNQRGSEYAKRALTALKEAGVRIALDEFGTNHSSFAHLRDYPIDVLRIDKTFVGQMLDNPSILAIVEATCMLGTRLSKAVVAEGIEAFAQVDALMAMGCSFAQGGLFGGLQRAAGTRQLLPQSCESTIEAPTGSASIGGPSTMDGRHATHAAA